MNTYCGADCSKCPSKESCKGCVSTCGSPFGGSCVAAEHIKEKGLESYRQFKEEIKDKINVILKSLNYPQTENLFELNGRFVNLEYTLPNEEKAKFLDDRNIYLGTQIQLDDLSCGVITDGSFILICTYKGFGEDPKLILYRSL
ncbi:MAG: hypothetical protein IKS54_11195 [Erysipelotrichaceae bacterium]|nr:hypothetical protein [Erysipelotrichaceae bacterium]